MTEPLTAVISNVQRFSTEDGPGIRTTVFFKGCPLHCPWCHNPEGLTKQPQLTWRESRCIGCLECRKVCPIGAPLPGTSSDCTVCGKCADACPAVAREIIGRVVTLEKLADEVERDKAFYGDEGGVTVSGGEAGVYPEFLIEFFALCKNRGLHVAFDTSGAISGEKFAELLGYTDLVLFDLKVMDHEKHKKIMGTPLSRILANLRKINESGIPFWVRVPIVEGYTDDDENLSAMINMLKDMGGLKRIDLLPFHQLGRNKWKEMGLDYSLEDLSAPSDERIEQIRKMFLDGGLPVSAG